MNFDIHFRIKQLRKHFNISANKLALELKISQPALSKIENGKNLPSWNLLERICNFFDLTISEFFDLKFFPADRGMSSGEKIKSNSLEIEFIGKKIKYLRESHSIQRIKFEEIFNISQSHMSRIENGKTPPQFELLENICTFFNISITDFFNLKIDSNSKLSQENKNIVTFEQCLVEKYNVSLSEIKAVLKIRKFSEVEKTLLNTLLDQYSDDISEDTTNTLKTDLLRSQRNA